MLELACLECDNCWNVDYPAVQCSKCGSRDILVNKQQPGFPENRDWDDNEGHYEGDFPINPNGRPYYGD